MLGVRAVAHNVAVGKHFLRHASSAGYVQESRVEARDCVACRPLPCVKCSGHASRNLLKALSHGMFETFMKSDDVVLISGWCEVKQYRYELIRPDPLSPRTYLRQNADHRTVCKAAVCCHGKRFLLQIDTGPVMGWVVK